MEVKDVFKYSLKRSEVKTLKVKLLLFETYYFKGQFLANGCYISFNDCKGHELWVYPPALFESTI